MIQDRVFGVVTTFDSFKGYGFIRRTKGKDVFFYYADLLSQEALVGAGDTVSFLLKEEAKGPRAYSVQKES